MFRNRSVNVHRFSMVPAEHIPRSAFRMQHTHKTTFDAGYLIPLYVNEVLPGDHFQLSMTAFVRMATPIWPLMDNLHFDTFWFYVPNRLVMDNWVKLQGEQDNPGDSVSYTIPQQVSPAGGYAVGSLQDYMGLPTVGQITAGQTFTHSALPLRGYNLIWNQWFRDEQLQNSVTVDKGAGPDSVANYVLLRRGKRPDYFTTALPTPQKGNAVSMPLGTAAPVVPSGSGQPSFTAAGAGAARALYQTSGSGPVVWSTAPTATGAAQWSVTGLQADLSTATAATINQIRQAFQLQRMLERDMRGGTRYFEALIARWGVRSPDMRLQRPEYLGSGHSVININPIAQNSASNLTGGSTPLGTLGAMATCVEGNSGFSSAFVEHGFVFCLGMVRADLTYQQGLRRMWSRLTRVDHYEPVFAHLGEQAVLNKEIYCVGGAAGGQDDGVFGYQERWAEYRTFPNQITGLFRSTAASTLDPWHAAQKFTSLPTLNSTFIQEIPPMARILAGSVAAGTQFLLDSFFDGRITRAMPLYSNPGFIDRF